MNSREGHCEIRKRRSLELPLGPTDDSVDNLEGGPDNPTKGEAQKMNLKESLMESLSRRREITTVRG